MSANYSLFACENEVLEKQIDDMIFDLDSKIFAKVPSPMSMIPSGSYSSGSKLRWDYEPIYNYPSSGSVGWPKYMHADLGFVFGTPKSTYIKIDDGATATPVAVAPVAIDQPQEPTVRRMVKKSAVPIDD